MAVGKGGERAGEGGEGRVGGGRCVKEWGGEGKEGVDTGAGWQGGVGKAVAGGWGGEGGGGVTNSGAGGWRVDLR